MDIVRPLATHISYSCHTRPPVDPWWGLVWYHLLSSRARHLSLPPCGNCALSVLALPIGEYGVPYTKAPITMCLYN